MGLNYAAGCVNFRDAFACVNLFAGAALLPESVLFRGGKLDAVTAPEQVGSPGTVFNLRKGPDRAENLFGADYFHFPISNDHEKYETTDPAVWIEGGIGDPAAYSRKVDMGAPRAKLLAG